METPEKAFGKREDIPKDILLSPDDISTRHYTPQTLLSNVRRDSDAGGFILSHLKQFAKEDKLYDFSIKSLKHYIVEMANSYSKWDHDDFIFPTEPPQTFARGLKDQIEIFETFRNGAMLNAIAQLYGFEYAKTD